MSSLWLAVALFGTFFAVVAAFFAFDAALADRRRAVSVLESQVHEAGPSVNLREQQIAGSFIDRALVPATVRLGRMLRRVIPLDTARIEKKLVYAGAPVGWDVEKVVSLKAFGAIAGLVLGIVVAGALGAGGALFLFPVVLLTILGFTLPSAWVSQRALNRQTEVRKALPDTMDLLTISVEAGLGFDAALSQVTRNVPGPLSAEISRMLQEMQIGATRVQAFRNLAERTDVEELQAFVLAMIQADMFGVSISRVLRAQARELRQKRRQRAEELAQKVPVKLLFPMIFCVLPSLFVVILGPGVLQALDSIFFS
jgi:tight adherence protein C